MYKKWYVQNLISEQGICRYQTLPLMLNPNESLCVPYLHQLYPATMWKHDVIHKTGSALCCIWPRSSTTSTLDIIQQSLDMWCLRSACRQTDRQTQTHTHYGVTTSKLVHHYNSRFFLTQGETSYSTRMTIIYYHITNASEMKCLLHACVHTLNLHCLEIQSTEYWIQQFYSIL